MRVLASAVVLAGSLTAGRPSAAPAVRDDPATTAWTLAVWQHVPGKADGALRTVAAVPLWRVGNALRGKQVLEDRRFLTRALILHTDLAIVEHQAAERGDLRPIAGVSGGSVVLQDGTFAGWRPRTPHWSVAMHVATILAEWRDPEAGRDAPPHPEARRLGLSWFRTVNALFMQWAEGTLRYVDTGLRHYPDDAVLHLYRGTMHQMYANGRVQQFRDGGAPGGGVAVGAQGTSVELARAETDLRRALELDPTLAQARIRLAHVSGDLGHPEVAVTLVREALGTSLPPFFESYAMLILGRNLIRAGRVAEANAAFDRAATLSPAAQAPRIGRSQVALAEGRPADALRALTEALGPDRRAVDEAEEWSTYFRVQDPAAAVQLAALRAGVE